MKGSNSLGGIGWSKRGRGKLPNTNEGGKKKQTRTHSLLGGVSPVETCVPAFKNEKVKKMSERHHGLTLFSLTGMRWRSALQ